MPGLRHAKNVALPRLSVSKSSSCQRVVSALEPLFSGGPTIHALNSNTVDVAAISTLAEHRHTLAKGGACLSAENRRTSGVRR
jgi:hypothetical protein